MSHLDPLIQAAGRWAGPSRLYLDPESGTADESLSMLTVVPVLGGRFVRLDYTWDFKGAAQEGSLLIGYDKSASTATIHWIDSFHMGDKVLVSQGTLADDRLVVRGSYAAPTGPDWGWQTAIEWTGEVLRVVMHNISPEGVEDLAVAAEYSRKL